MNQYFYTITKKKQGPYDVLFSVVCGFKDEAGTILASVKKGFRNDEAAAVAFATKKRELKQRSTVGGERQTSARDNEPRIEYVMTEAPAKA